MLLLCFLSFLNYCYQLSKNDCYSDYLKVLLTTATPNAWTMKRISVFGQLFSFLNSVMKFASIGLIFSILLSCKITSMRIPTQSNKRCFIISII